MKFDEKKARIIALLHGEDRAGIVARVSGWIYARGGNIVHADQHHDIEEGIFFQRIEWVPAGDIEEEMSLFRELSEGELKMKTKLSVSNRRHKVMLMVSKAEHCFGDILMRCRTGDLSCDLVGVISNHENMREFSELFGLKYFHTPINVENRLEVEKKQLEIIRNSGADLVVMARYMQVLSKDFLDKCEVPVINIHHSFLPAFAGAKPYHRAYERGVKIIGATAHYATSDLDEGPIISQDVTSISHRNTVDDLVRKGAELECRVLANAIRWHIESKILSYKNKTVVF